MAILQTMFVIFLLLCLLSDTTAATITTITPFQPLSDGTTLVSEDGTFEYLSAWRNWEDPCSGNFTYGVTRSNIPELQILNGSKLFYRSGPWNGIRFSGTPSLNHRPLFTYNFVYDTNEYYFQFYPRNRSLISRIVLNQTLHTLERFIWVEESKKWELSLNVPRDVCDGYNHCGSFGYCTTGSPKCECLKGFEPKSPQKWSEGCVHSKSWRCKEKNEDGFVVVNNMKTLIDVDEKYPLFGFLMGKYLQNGLSQSMYAVKDEIHLYVQLPPDFIHEGEVLKEKKPRIWSSARPLVEVLY
ncbi:hypothetical protein VNO78_06346 [Psophocarpus tetragonolobus]|uniref:EGF-like domain-containing protein n=1 Tax=Psophocarpus tetragonolobus TaxID=3891 RepID=A0AAN9SRY8_PSOTE